MNSANGHFLQHLPIRTSRLLLALGLLLFAAGFRFSDGSVLMAIANNLSIENPGFNELIQYNLDSPLKVLLLKLLPGDIISIGLVFGLLALSPVCGLLLSASAIGYLSLIAVFLTPALKIAVQNIGLGDGLVISLIVVACASRKPQVIGACFFLIGLWHPQQSFFIGLSYIAAQYCLLHRWSRHEYLAVLGSLGLAAVVFFLYKLLLGFDYHDRLDYLRTHLPQFIQRNLLYAPVAFAPFCGWLLLAPITIRGRGLLMLAWLLILAAAALATTDVTRVFTLISLPIVLIGAQNRRNPAPSAMKVLILCVLVQLIPAYSWSGLDYFMWPELYKDLCKWKHWCWPASA